MALSKNEKIAAVAGVALAGLFGYEAYKKSQAASPTNQKLPGKEVGPLPSQPTLSNPSAPSATDKTQLTSYLETMNQYVAADVQNATNLSGQGYAGMDDIIAQFGTLQLQIQQLQAQAPTMTGAALEAAIMPLQQQYDTLDAQLGQLAAVAPTDPSATDIANQLGNGQDDYGPGNMTDTTQPAPYQDNGNTAPATDSSNWWDI